MSVGQTSLWQIWGAGPNTQALGEEPLFPDSPSSISFSWATEEAPSQEGSRHRVGEGRVPFKPQGTQKVNKTHLTQKLF